MKKLLAILLTIAVAFATLPFGMFDFSTEAAVVTEYDFYAPGDITGDGDFKANDLSAARNVFLDGTDNQELYDAIDCTGDYDVDSRDFVRLKKHIANDTGESQFTYKIVDECVIITGYNGTPKGAITIPQTIAGHKVTKIADDAFKGCNEITSFLLPPTITDIGESAFESCESLLSIALPQSVNNVGKNAFADCINIFSARFTDSILIIPDNLFSGCTLLSKFEIPENVEEIGQSAFYLCSSLIELNIPKKVTVLNENTFNGCRNLVFVGLPENLKEIKTYTFYGCEKLTSVNIPITVVMVGDCAFKECSSMLSIVIPYETAFGKNVFEGCEVLVVKGYGSTGSIDAALNSGVKYETLTCGHSEYLLLNTVAPTCKDYGYSGDIYCAGCGEITQDGTTLEKSAHITEIVGAKEPTCTEYGYSGSDVCTVCNLKLTTNYILEPIGHFAKSMPGYVEATCTTNGSYGVFDCERCGKHIDNELIPAFGHDYSQLRNVVHADCVNDGYTGDRICYNCDDVEKGVVEKSKGDCYYALKNDLYPTCEKDGFSGDYICTGCGDIRTVGSVIPAYGHTFVTENYKAPTCTENGYSGDSVCIKCYKRNSGSVLPLLGHKSVLINYVETTCTEDGYTGDQYCSACHVIVTTGKVIEKSGHNYKLIGRVEATGSSSGYTGDVVCENCGDIKEKGSVIPAGHEHTLVLKNQSDATCEKDGYTGDKTCTECGFVIFGEVIPAFGHDCNITIVKPTCIDEGYTFEECKNCDYEKKYDFVSASGHKEGERTNVKAPTCTEKGYSGDYICSVCNANILGEDISATGHNFSEYTIICHHGENEFFEKYRKCNTCSLEEKETVNDETFEAYSLVSSTPTTCTENGVSVYKCNYCDYTYSLIETAFGHNYKVEVIAPTCTENGYNKHTCKNCGDTYNTDIVAATGHTEKLVRKTTPNCTSEGYTGDIICSVCNAVLEKGESIPAIGHDYIEIEIECEHQDLSGGNLDNPLGSVTGGGSSFDVNKNYAYSVKKCNNCNGYKYENIGLGNSVFNIETVESDCQTSGQITYNCKYCSFEYVKRTGFGSHKYVRNYIAPTCTETGLSTSQCSICNKFEYNDILPVTDHTYGEPTYTCYHTDHSISGPDGVGGGLDGDFGDDLDGGAEYAEKHRGCTTCGYTETENVDITYTMESYDTYDEYNCDYCDYSYIIEKEPPACSHNYETTYRCNHDTYIVVINRFCVDCGERSVERLILNRFEMLEEEMIYGGCGEYDINRITCKYCYYFIEEELKYNEHEWSYECYRSWCSKCYQDCYHDEYTMNGYDSCEVCGFQRCSYCETWEHDANQCPYQGGMWCPICGCPECMQGDPYCGCCPICNEQNSFCPMCGMPGCWGECGMADACPMCGMPGCWGSCVEAPPL